MKQKPRLSDLVQAEAKLRKELEELSQQIKTLNNLQTQKYRQHLNLKKQINDLTTEQEIKVGWFDLAGLFSA